MNGQPEPKAQNNVPDVSDTDGIKKEKKYLKSWRKAGKVEIMKTYRGAKINQEVVAEYTNNFYTNCKTCLKLADKKFYKAKMKMKGYDHCWILTLLPVNDYPMLYKNY